MPELALEPSLEQAQIITAFETGMVEGVNGPVERIDTALNHVFLAADRAYKIKRAIRLPFVDFRSAQRRREACDAELEINRRLGSPFYLGVRGIQRKGKGFSLTADGAGEEWAVEMRRFDSTARFDQLIASGRLACADLEATAHMIARMHKSAPVVTSAGHAADYRRIIQQLRATEADGAATRGATAASEELFRLLDAELARLDPLIEERRERGLVKRVHGDLHLRNICMFEGRPTAFDALEFDQRLATIDVLYDLSFLLMDLRRLDRRAEANAAMNAYWDAAGESECGLALLPFFMALRAAVRVATSAEEGDFAAAATFRALALDLLRSGQAATVAVGGLSGSGKSALARAIAADLPGPAGARILRSDVLRKRCAVWPEPDAAMYTPVRKAEIYRELFARAATAHRARASVVLDATFASQDMRDSLRASLPTARRFWLDAPADVRLARVAARRGDASDADVVVASAQVEPNALGSDWHRMNATVSLGELRSDVLRLIA